MYRSPLEVPLHNGGDRHRGFLKLMAYLYSGRLIQIKSNEFQNDVLNTIHVNGPNRNLSVYGLRPYKKMYLE
ncbi:hypothetical protein C7972_10954 [Arenibacter sp. ARW7G5Y1]|nr:hypothetical protein C7972_10954 [Arenibacter sp. ARW7G5Y1]